MLPAGPQWLRGDPSKPLGQRSTSAEPSSPAEGLARRLCCARCARPITSEEEATSAEGSHEHTRVNPAGVRFHFRCFARAPGCAIQGARTPAHSWFAGYVWQYAHCGGCGVHLGWYFQGGAPFFGLVAERLVAPS